MSSSDAALHRAHAYLEDARDPTLDPPLRLEALDAARLALLDARRARAPSAELTPVFTALLSAAAADPAAAARAVVPHAIEDLCLRDLPAFVPPATPFLAAALRDPHVRVVARAVRALTTLFRKTVGLVVATGVGGHAGFAEPVVAEWMAMQRAAVGLVRAPDEAVRKAAVKFAETVVLAFSYSGSAGSPDHFTLDYAVKKPSTCALLDPHVLEKDGMSCVAAVAQLVQDGLRGDVPTLQPGPAADAQPQRVLPPASFMTAVCVLGNLVRRRRKIVDYTLPPFIAVVAAVTGTQLALPAPAFAALSDGQRSSIVAVLRFNLASMRAYPHTRVGPAAADVPNATAALAAYERDEMKRREAERERAAAQAAAERAHQPVSGLPAAAAAAAGGAGWAAEARSAQQSLKRSRAGEPPGTWPRLPAKEAFALSQTIMQGMPPQEVACFIMTRLLLNIPPVDSVPGGQRLKLQNDAAAARAQARVDEPVQKRPRKSRFGTKSDDQLDVGRDVVPLKKVPVVRKVAPPVVAVRLTPMATEKLVVLCGRRMLTREARARASGAGPLRIQLLARLLTRMAQTKSEVAAAFCEEACSYIVANMDHNMSLAQAWLHSLICDSEVGALIASQGTRLDADPVAMKLKVEEALGGAEKAKDLASVFMRHRADTLDTSVGLAAADLASKADAASKTDAASKIDAAETLVTSSPIAKSEVSLGEGRAPSTKSPTVDGEAEQQQHEQDKNNKSSQQNSDNDKLVAERMSEDDLGAEKTGAEKVGEEVTGEEATGGEVTREAKMLEETTLEENAGKEVMDDVKMSDEEVNRDAVCGEKTDAATRREVTDEEKTVDEEMTEVEKDEVKMDEGETGVDKAIKGELDGGTLNEEKPGQAQNDEDELDEDTELESDEDEDLVHADNLAYERTFISMLEQLKDKGGASTNELFSTMVTEAPLVPASVIALLRAFCEDASLIKLGLHTLRDIVLKRPGADRTVSLDLLLDFTKQEDEVLRGPSIRLVANNIFPESGGSVAQIIEREAVQSLTSAITALEGTGGDGAGVARVERNSLLLTALCGQKAELLGDMASAYLLASGEVQAVLLRRAKDLAGHLGMEAEAVRQLIAGELLPAAPIAASVAVTASTAGATAAGDKGEEEKAAEKAVRTDGLERLALEVLQAVVKKFGKAPAAVVQAARQRYAKCGDPGFIMAVLSGLDREAVVAHLPALVQAAAAATKATESGGVDFKAVVMATTVSSGSSPEAAVATAATAAAAAASTTTRIGDGAAGSSTAALTPTELLVELHRLPPNAATGQAIRTCVELKSVFKQEAIAQAVQQAVEEAEVPAMVMRTVGLARVVQPELEKYLTGTVMQRLIERQVWKSEVLWAGFLAYCAAVRERSVKLVLSLPSAQVGAALEGSAELRAVFRDLVGNPRNAKKIPVKQRKVIAAVLKRKD